MSVTKHPPLLHPCLAILLAMACLQAAGQPAPFVTDADIARARREQPTITERDIEQARQKHQAPSDAELQTAPFNSPFSR